MVTGTVILPHLLLSSENKCKQMSRISMDLRKLNTESVDINMIPLIVSFK
jgi:hypothetical protein